MCQPHIAEFPSRYILKHFEGYLCSQTKINNCLILSGLKDKCSFRWNRTTMLYQIFYINKIRILFNVLIQELEIDLCVCWVYTFIDYENNN